jgi:molybdopterin-guanine dinucleotide biosynthesis protein A
VALVVDITGFILAGGRSLRMGRDKSQIPWGVGTMLSHALEQMKPVAEEVLVVGAAEIAEVSARVLSDEFIGSGPLSGIHAALAHTRTDWNLIVAIDMPLVNSELLGFISDYADDVEHYAIVPKIDGVLQPLCALYHRRLLPEADRVLKEGQLSVRRLLERVDTRIIEEQELVKRGFSAEMLMNVNTPQDLERARVLAETLNV